MTLKIISRITILVFLLNIMTAYAGGNMLYTVENAANTIDEIRFTDVESLGADYWGRIAIYKMAALGIFKGYGENKFSPSSAVTRAEAITLIYRAMSYEDKALSKAIEVEKERQENPYTLNNIDTWADGYLKLALSDGLITEKQYNEAMKHDQVLEYNEFNKRDAATREEVAFYMAKVLKLYPTYDNTHSRKYSDFHLTDSKIAPYFETILKENIMKGNNSFLYPKNTITRAEMAQVLENSKTFIYNSHGYYEESGEISSFFSGGFGVTKSSGSIDYIYTLNDVVVIDTDKIGGAADLGKGYKITYCVNSKNQVLFIKIDDTPILTPDMPTSFVTSGIVESINSGFITLYSEDGRTNPDLYRKFTLANTVNVLNNNKTASIKDISRNDKVFLNIVNNVVREISFSKSSAPKTVFQESYFEIENIYKAILGHYDSQNSKVVVSGVLKLEGETWGYTNRKGYVELYLDSSSKLYCDNREIASSELNEYQNEEVFIAVGRGKSGNEMAAFVRINLENSYHSIYDLQISEANASRFKAKGRSSDYYIGEGTIIIKDNTVSTWRDLNRDDEIYTVVKGSGTRYTAAVIYATSYERATDFDAYYGYLSSVKVGQEVVAQTIRYYDIKDADYRYYSRLKSFKLTSNTRIVDKNGIVNNRDLSAYSEIDGSRVYANIVTCDDEILAIGIGNEGDNALRGRVGYINREDGVIKSFYINSAKEYIGYEKAWQDLENQNLTVANNTIFIKKGKAVSAADITVGDSFIAYYSGGYYDKVAAIIIVT